MSAPVIAVDLGGTNLRAALFTEDAPEATRLEKVPTLAEEGPDAVIARMIAAIEAVAPADHQGLRIGVGAPGPLDPFAGVVLEAPNLPGWERIPLRDRLADHFGCPVALGNDANLAALGEWRHGAGRGTRHLIYLTVSTGIGGGVIVDGELLLGARGLAAELGHMTVVPDGPLCGCGQRGHLEAVAAGPALARRARELLALGRVSTLARLEEEIDARHVGRAAQEGDALAREVVAEAAGLIGRHLAGLAHAFNPEIFVIGGGVSRIGAPFFEPMERALRAGLMYPVYGDGLRLVPALLGDEAGLVGAMVLARG